MFPEQIKQGITNQHDFDFLENYLLNTSEDIINVFLKQEFRDQFCKQSGWTKERANRTFVEIFYHSKKII